MSGSWRIRGGRLSSLAVKPALRLNSRSRFQIRSPHFRNSAVEYSTPVAALSIAASSSAPMPKVVKRHAPDASSAAVRFWNRMTSSGLPSMVSLFTLIGVPSTSGEMV